MTAAPHFNPQMRFRIKVLGGPLTGQSFTFEKAVVEIGRGSDNDLVLSNDLRASRKHAQIHWDGDELHIVNLSTKSYLAVNGSEVKATKLEPGAVVLVGETEFRIDFKTSDHDDLHSETKTKVHFGESPAPAPTPALTPSPLIVQMPTVQQSRPAAFQPSHAPVSPMPPGGMGRSSPRPQGRKRAGNSGSKSGFYILVLVIALAFGWLLTSKPSEKKELTFRSTEQIEKDIELSQEELKEFEARKEKLDNLQYRRAQENYIRGFRDYKQGNYGRARESFQVVLNLDPDNELAKRYYQLARIKFDEMVKFHMLQGNRYREKKNWRMCKSSYFNVMTMISNNQDPVYREAKQYYNECSLAQEGRY